MARYTHGHHDSVLASHRTRTATNSAGYLLPYLSHGQRLLDIGSGPATITCDLAELVAPGRVVAIEPTPEAVAIGQSEARRRGVEIDFEVADVYELPFDDATFDVVHAHQVLQHVPDPVGALRAMARVCTAGGVIAARDADYAGFHWHPHLPALDAWLELYRTVARSNNGEPDAGRRLLGWAQQAGLHDITPSASVWCHATPEARQEWGEMWARRVLGSELATQAIELGLAIRSELEDISAGWQRWASATDGWIVIPHGEILARR